MKISNSFKITFLILCLTCLSFAQDPSPTPTPSVVGEVTVTTKFANSDPLYQKIRQNLNLNRLSSDCAVVSNLTLQKDKGVYLFRSGEIYFLEPVEGKVTGAVFMGDGEFSMTPPVDVEKKHLAIFTDAEEVKENFSKVVMYFSDKTLEAIKNSVNAKMTVGCSQKAEAASELKEKGDLLKKRFRFNMASRILADFLTPKRRGFFTSFIEGKKFGKLIYQIDPLGVQGVYPEQIALISYDLNDQGIWAAFHLEGEYKKGTAKSWTDRRIYDITDHDIETTLQGTRLVSKDTLTVKIKEPDIKFFPFDLYETLRVKTVTDENGAEMGFIQEKKGEDADFGIILDKAPEVGSTFKITVEYEGDGALQKAGTGNFFLGPRSTWYVNNPFTAFADRATFNLTFHYPKKFVLVSSGVRVGEDTVEGGMKTSKWSSDGVEFEVAAFNYGDFKMKKIVDAGSGYELEVFANSELPDEMKDYQMRVEASEARSGDKRTTMGAMNTLGGIDKVMAEAQNSARLYNAYFGKLPYKRISLTQQPLYGSGQSWTTLVFMPYMAYIDASQRVQMFGIRGGTDGFWTEVGPHEVAHQWWGHIVGWTSYRDQWMSEGFSELSASIYVQYVEKDINKFIQYWEDQRKLIVTATSRTKGKKPFTVGPITQGYRLNSAKTGNIYRVMIYPKGAYILHMLRMMMYDHTKGTGDARFKATMKDFIKANYNKPVSTEDFKQAVERNISPEMDIDKNKKMDWFFDEWIYGTEMPSYKLTYQLGSEGGKNVLTGKITQSGVSKNFVMIVPLYADFGKGWEYMASVTIVGNDSVDLGSIKMPEMPKKIAVAAMNDVLAEKIENVKQ